MVARMRPKVNLITRALGSLQGDISRQQGPGHRHVEVAHPRLNCEFHQKKNHANGDTSCLRRPSGDSSEGERSFQREAERCSAEGEQPSERSDAGRPIVPESVRLRQRPSERTKVSRSEAEELRRGFGGQGKGAASPFIPCLSL